MKRDPESPEEKYLGIEGGGTRTVALLVDASGRVLRRLETGPANMKLLTEAQLTHCLRSIAAALPLPDALGIGLSGAWAEADFTRIRSAAAKVWPHIPCYATNDLETALTAATDGKPDARTPQVLMVSGTGSGCYGQSLKGRGVKVGGWGHVLGDKGSGYDIGLQALQAVVDTYDHEQVWPDLGRRLLRALQLNEPNELIDWAQGADKTAIASLAAEVFAAWGHKDKLATVILAGAAKTLARDAAACARRLARRGAPVQFVLTGSILLKQPRFAALVGRELRKLWPKAVVAPLKRESVWGAIELARRAFDRVYSVGASTIEPQRREARREKTGIEGAHTSPLPVNYNLVAENGLPLRSSRLCGSLVRSSIACSRLEAEVQGPKTESGSPEEEDAVVRSIRRSPTEERNPRSMNLDKLPLRDAIGLMLAEDVGIPKKLRAERRRIQRVIEALVRAFRRGGRLFYVGAGTSGRLGVLDASECPPTFGTSPELVQGIIAGGQEALWQSGEGAEDDADAGGRAIEFRSVARRDVVIGIAASGTTPFVWGALREGKRRGATTVLVCFNPFLQIPRALRPSIVIAPNLGPELLTGSTRLKAGTATKQLLNMFTTLAMVRFGKVRSNLMIDVNPANVKLRDRAVRIVRALTGADERTAQAALERSGWFVKKAAERLRR
jgi:N-acetylmuramic acid 6-phosphate etherase